MSGSELAMRGKPSPRSSNNAERGLLPLLYAGLLQPIANVGMHTALPGAPDATKHPLSANGARCGSAVISAGLLPAFETTTPLPGRFSMSEKLVSNVRVNPAPDTISALAT